MIPYAHDVKKFAIGGLQLNLPPDLVPPTQYSILDNAVSRVEGRLDTRDGSELVCAVGASGLPVHSIFRLNQYIEAVVGGRLFGLGTQLWQALLPAGNTPTQLDFYTVAGVTFPAFPVAYDGKPLSIAAFRFDADPQGWAIIANGQKMMKWKNQYYEQLGLPAPTVQPIASVGSAGNLDGSYQWVYTYVNEVTQSESNPSLPSYTSASGVEIRRPTANVTPTLTLSGLMAGRAWVNPANAYDGNPATFAEGFGGPATGTAANVANVKYGGFASASAAYSALELHVIAQAVSATPVTGVGVWYSLDAGTTWNVCYGVAFSAAPFQEVIISLPPTTSLSLLQVYAGCGENFGGGSNDLRVYEIFTQGTLAATGPSGAGQPLTLNNERAVLCVGAPADPQETAIRFYRIGGTLPDAYRFLDQIPVADLVQGSCGSGYLEYTDNLPDTSIASSPILETDNDMPVSSVAVTNQTLKSIWNFDERILGCGDPARPDAVYFSKRGNADEWPSENWIEVADDGDECMAGLVWALRCFVWGREGLHQLLPNIIAGITFTPAKTSCRRGIKGRQAFCIGRKGMYFVSKDGVFRTLGAEEEPVMNDIQPIFPTRDGPGRNAGTYEAVDMTDEDGLRLEYHNEEIWFDYTGKTSGLRRCLVYNEDGGKWRSEVYAEKAQMAYSEPGTDSSLLRGMVNGTVRHGSDLLEGNVDVLVRTGAYDQGQPLNLKEYGNVIFDLDTGGVPITITPYINGDQLPQAAIVVPAGAGRQRVALPLQDVYALNISFEIAFTAQPTHLPTLYQMDILYRFEPAAMKHWEVPPISLGSAGWFHMRDAYVVLRSAADVTMTITPDNGDPQVFTIVSTGGAKLKVYLRFNPNKQKLAQFSFNSEADFRLYQEECELRAKQWAKPLGYQVIPLFGAEDH